MSYEEMSAQQLSVTGTWKIDTVAETGPEKGKSKVLLIESGGGIIGEWGTTLFTGSRDGRKVSLRARSEGTAAELTLTLTSAESMSGTLVQTFVGHGRSFTIRQLTMERKSSEAPTSLVARGEPFDEIASRRQRGVTMKTLAVKPSDSPKGPRFVIPDRKNVSTTDDGIISDMCNWVVSGIFGALTEEIFVPMAPCNPSANGGGYYLFGSTGPGSRMIFTTTIYYPWEDVSGYSCESREYNFTFSLTETSYFQSLISFLKSIKGNPVFGWLPGISELITTITDFYNEYGDFAIIGGFNTNTGSLTFYCVCTNTQTGQAILSNSVIETLLSIVAVLTGNDSYSEQAGNPIYDSYSLARNDMLYYPCNTPLIFMYIVGTMPVQFN